MSFTYKFQFWHQRSSRVLGSFRKFRDFSLHFRLSPLLEVSKKSLGRCYALDREKEGNVLPPRIAYEVEAKTHIFHISWLLAELEQMFNWPCAIKTHICIDRFDLCSQIRRYLNSVCRAKRSRKRIEKKFGINRGTNFS